MSMKKFWISLVVMIILLWILFYFLGSKIRLQDDIICNYTSHVCGKYQSESMYWVNSDYVFYFSANKDSDPNINTDNTVSVMTNIQWVDTYYDRLILESCTYHIRKWWFVCEQEEIQPIDYQCIMWSSAQQWNDTCKFVEKKWSWVSYRLVKFH